MREEWKHVKELKGHFEVSNTGKVRSFARSKEGYLRKLRRSTKGYLVFQATPIEHDKGRPIRVHRLVASYFCHGYRDGLCVNHKNGNKEDNRASNLEWVSLRQNSMHAHKSGLFDNRGENSGMAKLKEADVLKIRELVSNGVKHKEIAEKYKIHIVTVSRIVTKARWAHV